MDNATIINLDVDTRVDAAINRSMDIYMNKLASGFLEIGLENTFQMSLADIISKELDLNTYYDDERFMVKFEKNMPINGNNDYVDIVIEYKRDKETKLYLIELKFKKVSDSAPDLGNCESYIDIYNLDSHKNNTANVCGCYYIFLTNYKTYLSESKKGTRAEIPMHDGYTIKANKRYNVTGNAARKKIEKYPYGFLFSADYSIQYKHMEMPNVNTIEKDYWFYIIRM